jgi:protein SCO1
MTVRPRRLVVAFVVVVAALVVAGCVDPPQDFDRAGAEEYGLQGSLIEDALAKPDVVFTDTEGRPYDLRTETAGELTLVFFGYSSCPDVCPIHLGTIADAFQKADLDGGVPNMVFVGVDTARDTPEKLRAYLDRFDSRFVGLTASPEEIDRAMAQLLLPAAVIDPEGEGGDNYRVGHPSQVVVFTPDDRAHIVYPFGATREVWVDDLPRLERIDWEDRR